MDHLAVADVHADVVDGPRRGGEEQQVTGLEVRRGHGLAGLRLVPRVAWQVDAVGSVDAVGEPGAVESVGGDAGPQIAQAVELLRGLHEVLAAGLLGLLSDVVDINVVGVDPGRSPTGEGDADIVDVLGDERQVDVEADVGTGVLGELDAFEVALRCRHDGTRLLFAKLAEPIVLDQLLRRQPARVALLVLRRLLVLDADFGPAALDVEDGDFGTVDCLRLGLAGQAPSHIGALEVLVPFVEVDGVAEGGLVHLAGSVAVGPESCHRDIDVGGLALFDLSVTDPFEFLTRNDISRDVR